jgi:hypothetical protein
MADDPIDAVYSYVERAYVRLQAGDILIRCMEEGNASPMQQMVEGLVLAGPKSLSVLREMRSESAHRKSQILDDLHQVYSDLENSLGYIGCRTDRCKKRSRDYGVKIGQVCRNDARTGGSRRRDTVGMLAVSERQPGDHCQPGLPGRAAGGDRGLSSRLVMGIGVPAGQRWVWRVELFIRQRPFVESAEHHNQSCVRLPWLWG